MSRMVSPPINQLEKLRQPLTAGEKMVFNFFNKNLPSEWEIYIHPHLNGLRPDFVLLNPNSGVAIFEIKDWDLDAMDYWVEERGGKAPKLYAQKKDHSKAFSLQNHNPIEKLYQYKQELYDIYCPRLKKNAGLAAITAGVIFPFANEQRVKELFSKSLLYRGWARYPEFHPISGKESLEKENISAVFPESQRSESFVMNKDVAKDLRNWLVEPDFASQQREPLTFDKDQKYFVTTRTGSGYRRLKGPAGSGKSHILGARAAELLGKGKEVLVITYNITLLHYLMDIASRWPASNGKTRTDITWLNFHSWCKRICIENDYEEEYKGLWRDQFEIEGNPLEENNEKEFNDEILENSLPELVSNIIDEDKEGNIKKYDAILVDEGQDFSLSWWNTLRKACRPDGEMLLVVDTTQDVYGKSHSWTDEAMIGAGFPGRWAELKVSYRLPPRALKYARKFAEQFLPTDLVDLPESKQGELDLFPSKLKWIQTKPEKVVSVCTEEMFLLVPSADPDVLAISDITFLVRSQKIGMKVVKELDKKGVKVLNTFDEDSRESRRRKMGFFMGDARIKATTLHSFKGWESRAIVLYIGEFMDRNSKALIYTGLTRLKKHVDGSYLTVVSCVDGLRQYGKTWPDYKEI